MEIMNRVYSWQPPSLRLGVVIVALLTTVACASTQSQRSAGEYVDDATVTARVKSALVDNEKVKARQVEVESHRGVVQLNGFVDSAAARSAATQVTGGIDGVREVRNNLVVQAGDQSAGEVIDDSYVTAKVKAALIANSQTSAADINVTTSGGIVQLAGFVDSTSEKSRAAEVARSVTGVRDVRNDLDIKPSPPR